MKTHLLAAALTAIGMNAYAGTVTCNIPGYASTSSLSWDTKSGAATMTDLLGTNHKGRVTRKIPHDDGVKVNLSFELAKPFGKATSAEYIVFPLNGSHKVIGTGYVKKGQDKYLDILMANSTATCR